MSRRLRSSSFDLRRKDHRLIGKKPRVRRRKTTVMNDDDKYDDCRLLLLRLSVELAGADTTTNH